MPALYLVTTILGKSPFFRNSALLIRVLTLAAKCWLWRLLGNPQSKGFLICFVSHECSCLCALLVLILWLVRVLAVNYQMTFSDWTCEKLDLSAVN